MATIEWRDEYNLKIEYIDDQRRKLVEMVNGLQDALPDGVLNTENVSVLASLVEYARSHFEAEEKLLRQIEYAEYNKHKGSHADIRQQIVKLLVDVKQGKQLALSELLDHLKAGLIEHVTVEDKKIGQALTSDVRASLNSLQTTEE